MPSPFRTSRALVLAVSSAVALGVLTTGSAHAEESVATLQVKLVEQRQQLNALYAKAARAGELMNGANLRLAQAKADLAKREAARKQAQAAYAEQRDLVGELTVDQLQNGTPKQAMMKVLAGAEPTELLQEMSSLKTVDEALTARIDLLDASRTSLDASTKAFKQVVADQKEATADRAAAQATIEAAITQAESLAASTQAQRDTMLKQLAAESGRSLADVTAEQDAIDEQIDQQGPGVPPPAPSNPQPTTPAPTTPKPTTPAPTTPPPASSSKVEKAIAYAKAQLGEPYKWGGAGPSSWDCSGLTMKAYGAAGVSLSHYAPSQYTATKKVSVSAIKRGDLLYWSDGSAKSIYHVAIYLGDGQMIHAPRPGRNVEIVPLSYWIKPDLASRPG